jgi:hypothetical protein
MNEKRHATGEKIRSIVDTLRRIYDIDFEK